MVPTRWRRLVLVGAAVAWIAVAADASATDASYETATEERQQGGDLGTSYHETSADGDTGALHVLARAEQLAPVATTQSFEDPGTMTAVSNSTAQRTFSGLSAGAAYVVTVEARFEGGAVELDTSPTSCVIVPITDFAIKSGCGNAYSALIFEAVDVTAGHVLPGTFQVQGLQCGHRYVLRSYNGCDGFNAVDPGAIITRSLVIGPEQLSGTRIAARVTLAGGAHVDGPNIGPGSASVEADATVLSISISPA